jgi:hypothetical protein
MPHGGNFNPEWGYLAPKPGLIRSFRTALVAGGIGTVGGMALAVALVARPAADVSVSARTLARPHVADTMPKAAAPKSVSALDAEVLDNSSRDVAPPPQTSARSSPDRQDVNNLAAAESHSTATVQQPASAAALAEAPVLADNAADAPSKATPALLPKRASKKEQIARLRTSRTDRGTLDDPPRGPLDLFPLIGRTIIGANRFWNDQVR